MLRSLTAHLRTFSIVYRRAKFLRDGTYMEQIVSGTKNPRRNVQGQNKQGRFVTSPFIVGSRKDGPPCTMPQPFSALPQVIYNSTRNLSVFLCFICLLHKLRLCRIKIWQMYLPVEHVRSMTDCVFDWKLSKGWELFPSICVRQLEVD
jgi:hypothetical protein